MVISPMEVTDSPEKVVSQLAEALTVLTVIATC